VPRQFSAIGAKLQIAHFVLQDSEIILVLFEFIRDWPQMVNVAAVGAFPVWLLRVDAEGPKMVLVLPDTLFVAAFELAVKTEFLLPPCGWITVVWSLPPGVNIRVA